MNEIIDGKTGEVIDIDEAINSPQAKMGLELHHRNEQILREAEEEENTLSPDEEKQLKVLEDEIAENLKGFMVVGMALMEIRDKRLYRQKFDRFEDYCKIIWDMAYRRANQLIAAKEVVDNLSERLVQQTNQMGTMVPISDEERIPLPQNERQVRELLKLKNPEEQLSAWQETLEAANESGNKITASLIKKTVQNRKDRAFDELRENAAAELAGDGIESPEKVSRTNQTTRESEDFRSAWHALMEQIAIEKRANWRNTDRYTVLRALVGIVDHLNETYTAEERPYGCTMELSDREKLKAAGFEICRMNVKYKVIEKWHREDQWTTYRDFESASVLKKEFEKLMQNPMALKG